MPLQSIDCYGTGSKHRSLSTDSSLARAQKTKIYDKSLLRILKVPSLLSFSVRGGLVHSFVLIQNLRVIFNWGLCFDDKLHSVIQMSYFYPRNAARLEFALSQGDCEMLIHSCVTSWLGSSHPLLTALTGSLIQIYLQKMPPETKHSCIVSSGFRSHQHSPQERSVLILTISPLMLIAVHLSDPLHRHTLLQAHLFTLLLVDWFNDLNESREHTN